MLEDTEPEVVPPDYDDEDDEEAVEGDEEDLELDDDDIVTNPFYSGSDGEWVRILRDIISL